MLISASLAIIELLIKRLNEEMAQVHGNFAYVVMYFTTLH